MREELYGTRLYINYSQLENNINYIKNKIKKAEIIAMVKANAYGCGDLDMSQKMEELGINYFGVADFEEGVRLRNNGIKSPIMVMNTTKNSLEAIIDAKLEPVVYGREMLNHIINKHLNISELPLKIHIKINTGMNRWGFNMSDFLESTNILKKYSEQIIVKSLYSHLPSAENREDDLFTQTQIRNLIQIKEKFTQLLKYDIKAHIHNSFGLIYFEKTMKKFDYCRIGIGIYAGIKDSNLKLISELRCKVGQIRNVEKNQTVGYNRGFIARKAMKIAILPFGYADGLQRNWGNGILKFFYKGHFLPTIGNISMDSCAIDITDVWEEDMVIDRFEVVYFGKERSIWDLSKELQTTPYEILATLSRRIKRIYC